MKWTRSQKSDGYILITGEDKDGPIVQGLSGLVDQFIESILPLPHPVWEYVRVEIWSDSARAIMFPTSSKWEERRESGCCQVILGRLEREYENLPDPESEPDAFDAALAAMEMEVADTLKMAVVNRGAIKTLSRRSVRFACFSGTSKVPLLEFEVGVTSS